MIGGANIKSGVINEFYCDDNNDVANLEQFGRDHNLAMGSKCYCIGTGKVYMMKSTFEFVEIE